MKLSIDLWRVKFDNCEDARDYLLELARLVHGPAGTISQGYDLDRALHKDVLEDIVSKMSPLMRDHYRWVEKQNFRSPERINWDFKAYIRDLYK